MVARTLAMARKSRPASRVTKMPTPTPNATAAALAAITTNACHKNKSTRESP